MRLCFIVCTVSLYISNISNSMEQKSQELSSPQTSAMPQNAGSTFLLPSSSNDSFFLEDNNFQRFDPLDMSSSSSQISEATEEPESSTSRSRSLLYQELWDTEMFRRRQHLTTSFNRWKKKYQIKQDKKWDFVKEDEQWDLAESSHDLTEDQQLNISQKALSRSALSNTATQSLQWLHEKIKSITFAK